jgi:excinuclease ABC subunit A
MIETTCPLCHGSRLKDEVLTVKVGKKNIWEVTNMSIKDLIEFFDNIKLNKTQQEISNLLIKEIKS